MSKLAPAWLDFEAARDVFVVAGTGHRPDKLGGYSEQVDLKLRDLARRAMERHYPLSHVISGMAIGWDMALAEAAKDLGIQLIAAIPFVGQEKRWPKATQERYQRILEEPYPMRDHALAWQPGNPALKEPLRHTAVMIICDGGYAPWKMQRRNEWMVDNCHQVFALWNGSDGGTANCVKYATKFNRPIENLWGVWQREYVTAQKS